MHSQSICIGGSCKKKSKSKENRDTSIVKTDPIFTSFYRELGTDYPGEGGSPIPKSNYDEYDLFCLRTKLEVEIYKDYPDSSLSFLTYEYKGKEVGNVTRMVVTIVLTVGGKVVSLSSEESEKIQAMVWDLQGDRPRDVLLFDGRVGPSSIPSSFSLSLVPFLYLDTNKRIEVSEGRIYIDLEDEAGYEAEYERLKSDIDKNLLSLYEEGVIVLHPDLNSDIIENWGLEPITATAPSKSLDKPQVSSKSEISPKSIGTFDLEISFPKRETDPSVPLLVVNQGSDVRPYKPNWNDSRFAPNLQSFIANRIILYDMIDFRVDQDKKVREAIEKVLRDCGYDNFIYMGPYLSISAMGIEEATNIANLISTIWSHI